ncbi:MAG: dihydrofolate reductase [Bacteroidales bacterium]|nr:dihydrofolate reductase [Bacteroidales bacterium]
MKPSVSIIAAMTRRRAIGFKGDMPWKMEMKADLKHFKEVTMGHPIIMGRKTFESFPKGPLPGRKNIVVTRNANYKVPDGVSVVSSIEDALKEAEGAGEVFVIGGAQIFSRSLHLADKLYLTIVEGNDFPGADTFFPEIDPDLWILQSKEHHEADEKNKYPYSFTIWTRK